MHKNEAMFIVIQNIEDELVTIIKNEDINKKNRRHKKIHLIDFYYNKDFR
ncbi:MAG: hypothetical protein PUK80_05850 [Firmicutes bacterium]|nr:hypothetical protein [Bacillota bacterium]